MQATFNFFFYSYECSLFQALIQIAAASIVARDVAYFTFGDEDLRDELADLHQFLCDQNVNVGKLLN